MPFLKFMLMAILAWGLGLNNLWAQTTFNIQNAETVALNDGSLSYTYAFNLPPSRGRYQPTLALAYNSNGGNSPYGFGVSLSVAYIERIVSASPTGDDGNPRLVLQLVSPMASGTLVSVGKGHYRLATEQTYFHLQLIGPPLTGQEFRPVPSRLLNTNLQNMDTSHFDVPEFDQGVCQAACANDAACFAYTYGKNPPAQCWIKHGAAKSTADPAFDSGTKDPSMLQSFEAVNFDRIGSDRKRLDIDGSMNNLAALTQCQQSCLEDPDCRAYAFRKQQTGPYQCWLKGEPVPVQTWREGYTSGVKPPTWEAYDGQGNHYRFDHMVDVRGEVCHTACVRWYLSSVEEVDGNMTKYDYSPQGHSAGLLLARISYNNYDPKNPSNTGRVGDTGAYANLVELSYSEMPPWAQVSAGSLVPFSQRLSAIRMSRPGPQGTVSTGGYNILYSSGPETGRSRMSGIIQVGRDGIPASNQTGFEYSGRTDAGQSTYRWFHDGVPMGMPGSPSELKLTPELALLWC